MPYCTWGPESGGNYRALNPSSRAGGKYQILPSTWRAFGGGRYAAEAVYAKPRHQELIARRVLYGQGIHAWVNC